MFEFLKEQYTRYPNSIPGEKKINISDILTWKTQRSTFSFIIDHIAIENSYDHSTWERTLKNTFGIEIFKDEEEKRVFEILNLCRNAIIHSGGKTNSKIMRDFEEKVGKDDDQSKVLYTIEEWSDLFDQKLFIGLLQSTSRIVDRIEKHCS